VFASAVDAVSACAEGQRALADYPWPQGVAPLIRMGLHTGEPTRHEDGYIGMDVHRAARIAASAHGGQVVMSEATHQLVAGQLGNVWGGGQEGKEPRGHPPCRPRQAPAQGHRRSRASVPAADSRLAGHVCAARLLGTTEALREQAGMPIRGPDAELLAEFLTPARALLTADQWEQERRTGRTFSVQEALAQTGVAG
jgi:hypothetical protein